VGILSVGLPVYCAGITPNSPARNGPGTVGHTVTMGGMTIAPGDIVIGDNDGVVIIPLAQAETILGKLKDVKAAEAALEAKVKAGLQVPDFVQAILDSDRVVEG
jgi:4-hydroxy-4-methyl-2-oxoglutarate aldolase